MLRRPSDRYLTLEEIADDWSREIQPPRTKSELAAELGKSWWRGEIKATRGPTRLQVLQRLFGNWGDVLTFQRDGEPAPQTSYMQPSCSDQHFRVPVVPVPSAAPELWADGECVPAYEAIAECWGKPQLEDVDFQVTNCVALQEPDFTKWIEQETYHTRPKFWVAMASSEAAQVSGPPNPIPEKVLVKTSDFVRQYITDMKAAEKNPTKSGLEKAAKDSRRKGNRDLLRKLFDQQMGKTAPGRGRPKS